MRGKVKNKPGRSVTNDASQASVKSEESKEGFLSWLLSVWEDISGKSEDGRAENPKSFIVLFRILIGAAIISVIYFFIFKNIYGCFNFVNNHYIDFGIRFIIMIICVTITLWMVGKISGPRSMFKYSIVGVGALLYIYDISGEFNRKYFDADGAPQKWYQMVDGKPVVVDLALNYVKRDANNTEYFIHPNTGDTCRRLIPAVKKIIDSQNGNNESISDNYVDNSGNYVNNNDTLLTPRNRSYDFILDSNQVTKMLTFPKTTKPLKVIWQSNWGNFHVLVDDNADGIIDRELNPDRPIGNYEILRIQFKGLGKDTVHVQVTE